MLMTMPAAEAHRAEPDIERIGAGPRMSEVVVHNGTAYLMGVVAKKGPPGRSVGEQTAEILATIDERLALAGTDRSRMLMVNIWLADARRFDEMNAVWDAWVAPGCTPARATVEAKLMKPEFDVEIAVIAAV